MIDEKAFGKAWLEHVFERPDCCYAGDVKKIIQAYEAAKLAALPKDKVGRVARVINERANLDYNAYMIGKNESIAMAQAVLDAMEEKA